MLRLVRNYIYDIVPTVNKELYYKYFSYIVTDHIAGKIGEKVNLGIILWGSVTALMN